MVMTWRWESRPGLAGPHGGATRPVMMGRLGAVASAHPLASTVGMDVLREGGNAFDAAVAVSATVPLGEPHMSGIGGVGSATVYHAASDTLETLDFESGPPAALGQPEPRGLVTTGGLATAWVPGIVAGWTALLDRYGTRKLDRLLQPAIEHARRGVPVSFMLSAILQAIGENDGPYIARRAEGFVDQPTMRVLMPNGRAPFPGEVLAQEQLAATVATIAGDGPMAFYRGSIAQQIVAACAAQGGHIAAADLAAVEATWRPSVHIPYRDHVVHSMPWPTGGPQLLETLGLLNGIDLAAFGLDSADHIHTLVECIKLAQADRTAHLGDASFDAQQLLAADHLGRLRSEIDPRRARQNGDDDVRAARRAHVLASTNTTHFVTADGEGNFVSWTQTLGRHFGSRTMAGETGIILNNFAQAYPRRGLPMAASIVTDSRGKPWLAVGAVGPLLQSIPQMISHVIDFELNPQAAVEAPRICVFEDFRVMLEGRFPEATVRGLGERGHQCEVVGEWAFGEGEVSRGQMIVRDRNGTLMAASDTRADGTALAI